MIHLDDFIDEFVDCEETETGEFLCNHGHNIRSNAIQTYIAQKGAMSQAFLRTQTISKQGKIYLHWLLYHSLPKVLKNRIKASKKTETPINFELQRVHTLGSGGSFGEIALIEDKPRQARVVAITDLHLAIVQKDDYDKCLLKFQQRDQQSNIDFLMGTPFFKHWSKYQAKKLIEITNSIEIIRNQVVI